MAAEGKEKKRKAATPVALGADDPQPKKTKKSKPAPAKPAEDGTAVATDRAAQSQAPTTSSVKEIQTNTNMKPRQRADDFLDHDGQGDVAATVRKSNVDEIPSHQKPEKQSKNINATNGKAARIATNAEMSTTKAVKESSDVGTAAKSTKIKSKPKSQGTATTGEPLISTAPAKRKRGPTTVDVHAEKIKKLLGQKDELLKQNKKGANGSSIGLSAGVNAPSHTASGKSAEVGRTGAEAALLQAGTQHATEDRNDDEDNSGEDVDQADALLNGLDSDSEDLGQDEGFDKDKPVGALPNYKKTQKKLRQAGQKGNKDGPGTVYVGRIPHGFYETEMRQYFSQFGTITKLRLSRNRKTGHSKHFAFLEFQSNEVAKIVAETMDNYLMYGHILKCKHVPSESLHPDTFKGANKRFRVAPHNRMEKRALEAPKSESQWTKKNEKEQARREKKAEKLKAMGYEIELPKLKSPSDVLHQQELQTAEDGKGSAASEANEKEVPAPSGVPEDEIAIKKKEKTEKKRKIVATETNGAREQDQASFANAPVPSENRSKRKEKQKRTGGDEKQIDAPLVTDGTPTKTNGQPAKTPAEAMTTTLDAAEPSQASKSKKKKKKVQGEEEEQNATDKTPALAPAPAPANIESTSVEEAAPQSTAPALSSIEGNSKKKSKKRKSPGGDHELGEAKVTEEPRTKHTSKKSKKD